MSIRLRRLSSRPSSLCEPPARPLALTLVSCLLAGCDHIRRDLVHIERLQLGERTRHVEQRKLGLTVDRHFEAALARLLLVDDDLSSRESSGNESLELRGPRLEGASGFACLDLDDDTTGGGLLGRCHGRLGLGLLVDCLLGRHFFFRRRELRTANTGLVNRIGRAVSRRSVRCAAPTQHTSLGNSFFRAISWSLHL